MHDELINSSNLTDGAVESLGAIDAVTLIETRSIDASSVVLAWIRIVHLALIHIWKGECA